MKHEPEAERSGRRAFLRRAGAAASAAVVPGAAATVLPRGEERTGEDAAAIRELYQEYVASFPARSTAPGGDVQLRLLRDPLQVPDTIEIAADGQSARARFHCMMRTARPLAGHAPLLEMARLQGQHWETWWEAGVHELDCVKADGRWEIRQVAYRGGSPVTLR